VQRYHTPIDTFNGIEEGIMRPMPADSDAGFWVLHEHAELYGKRLHEEGYAAGLVAGRKDRARLEKVVKDAAILAAETAYSVANLLDEAYGDQEVAPMSQAAVDLTMDAAKLKQFADTYAE
jgi:hypothetical protein